MLGRISAALQSAVETIVPPVPLLEDFVYHWRMITKFYSHTTSNFREPIESTNVGAHIEQLMKILIEEETEEKCSIDVQLDQTVSSEDDISTGPCLEYLLEHRLLDILTTLASTDQPIGMRTFCLEFFSRLLSHLRPPILPHVAIIAPMKKVVELCLQTKASPTEVEEVNFLCTLCAVMGKNPTLINVYLSVNGENIDGDNVNVKTEIDRSVDTSPVPVNQTEEQPRLHLCDALLNYLQSADYRVVLRACEGLMLLASLPSDSLAGTLVLSGLHEALPNRLAHLFSSIPMDLDPNNLDDVHATWGLDSPQWIEGSKFPGCHQVAAFLAWLDYCDQMVRESHPCIGGALAVAIKEQFFKGCIQTALYEADCGASVILATAELTKCVRIISAPCLLEELCHWLVGEEGEFADANGDGEPGNTVLQLLLDNCIHELDEVSLESLRLFEVLIDSQLEPVIHSLALKQLLSRAYCSSSRPRQSRKKRKKEEKRVRLELENSRALDTSSKNEECSATESTSLLDNWSDKEPEDMLTLPSPGSLRLSKTLAPSNISEIITCFLNILPQQLRTSDLPEMDFENPITLTEEQIGSMTSCGYEQYIQEANRQYREVFVRCASYSWPREAKSPESLPSSECSTPPASPSPPSPLSSPRASSGASDDSADLASWDSRPEADFNHQFNEGPFLSMLIARLENLPYQAHEINLQATALVSRLALLPHPHLHEWLLNPLIKITAGSHTVYLALCNAAQEMETKVPLIPDFQKKLSNTRKILLGGAEDDASPRIRLDEEEARMLESVIVLEEFCKELAAIAFVKFHYSS